MKTQNNTSFMQQLAAGQVKEDDIDNFIYDWHELKLLNPISLHSYLGMTHEEYVAWVECRLMPREILVERSKMNKVVCNVCEDTHERWSSSSERWITCLHCPIPCKECNGGGQAAFCVKTPCDCQCHPAKQKTNDWYVGPLTKERLADLRYKLAKARGLLVSFINWETDETGLTPATQEVKDILKETEDP
jgi:hypothetical protein